MADPEIIFLFAVGLLAGMFAAGAGIPLALVLAGGAVGVLIFSTHAPSLRNVKVVLVALAGILAGVFYFHLHSVISEADARWPTTEEPFTGLVTDIRPYGAKGQMLTVSLREPWAGTFKASLPLSQEAEYGDVREFRGRLVRERDPSPIFIGRSENRIAIRQGNPVKHSLLDLRASILARYASLLSPNEAGLLGGLTLGARATFPEELKRDFALSGTTHLVALSGYNIGILILVFASSLGGFLSRRTTFLVTVSGIVLFVLMTGAEASIVRAALMGSLLLVAREAGRIYSVRHALIYAALIMALLKPSILAFDLGFQLSFMSFLGVSYLAPAFARLWKIEPKGGWLNWKENLTTTLGAQAAVLPLLFAHFESFPLASIPANLVLLPFVPVTMGLGFLLALTGALSDYLAFIIAGVAHLFLAAELAVIRLAATSPTTLHLDLGSPILMIGYYATLVLFVLGRSGKGVHPQPQIPGEVLKS